MQVKLRRAAHTVNGYTFPGSSVTGELVDVGSEHSKGRNPYAVVRWPTGAQYYFRVNSGWGEKPVKSFQIEPESLALVQELAREKKLKVVPMDAPPSVKRLGTKRPKSAPEEQLRLGGENE